MKRISKFASVVSTEYCGNVPNLQNDFHDAGAESESEGPSVILIATVFELNPLNPFAK